MDVSAREPEGGKGPPCDCASASVIDASRHAWDCRRRLWIERNDARTERRGAVSLDELLDLDVCQTAHEAYLHGDTQAALRAAFRAAIAKGQS